MKIEMYCGAADNAKAHREFAHALTQEFGGLTVTAGVGFWIDPDDPECAAAKERSVIYNVIADSPEKAAPAIKRFLLDTNEKGVLVFATAGTGTFVGLPKGEQA